MSRRIWPWLFLLSLILTPALSPAAVDLEIVQRLALKEEPLDAVAAPNGKYIYVLTRSGEVVVFDAQGNQTGAVAVGKDIKAIRLGAGDGSILLLSADKRQVALALVNFTYKISIDGNPFKGRPDAAVEVVVFSDFQ